MKRQENENLSKTDLAILNKIYSSKDPDAMLDYIYELLTNPLKFKEELAKHGISLEA